MNTSTSHAGAAPTAGPPRSVEVSPTWLRALALLPEAIISGFVGLAVASAQDWVDWTQVPPDPRWNWFDQAIDTLNSQALGLGLTALAALAALGALGLCFDVVLGAAPFKRMVGLRLIDARGRRPALWRLVVRNAVRPLSAGLLGWGMVWAAFDRHRRAWHDKASGVYVIRDEP